MNASVRRQVRVVAGLFGVGAILIATLLVLYWPVVALFFDGKRSGHVYSIPARSMMPTLVPGDRILPRQVLPGEPNRGDVVVFHRTKDDIRVARVAAVGGDRIVVRGDVPWVNGVAARWVELGAGPVVENGRPSRLYAERLPGEQGSHRILKLADGPLADFPETVIPSHRLFVLGDNRDMAADSRAPLDMEGAGLVPVDQVLGIVDYVAWSSVKNRMARPIDRPAPLRPSK